MKSLVFICLIMTGVFAAGAQSVNEKIPVSETAATPAKNATRVVYTNQSAMSFIDMHVKEKWAYFDNIQGLGLIKAHVTNASGRELFVRKLGDKVNAIDVSTLPKGLYFITLINDNTEERKAFTLNL